MRISDCSSDVCSSDLLRRAGLGRRAGLRRHRESLRRARRMKRVILDRLQQARADKRAAALVTDLTDGRQRLQLGGDNLGDLDLTPAQEAAVSDAVSADRSRSEEHTSELQSLMRISYAVFCLKKKK